MSRQKSSTPQIRCAINSRKSTDEGLDQEFNSLDAHPLTKQGLATDWSYWETYDRDFLSRCNALLVLMLDGWEESVGVQAEITVAEQLGKPVWYHDPADWPATFAPVTEVIPFTVSIITTLATTGPRVSIPRLP